MHKAETEGDGVPACLFREQHRTGALHVGGSERVHDRTRVVRDVDRVHVLYVLHVLDMLHRKAQRAVGVHARVVHVDADVLCGERGCGQTVLVQLAARPLAHGRREPDVRAEAVGGEVAQEDVHGVLARVFGVAYFDSCVAHEHVVGGFPERFGAFVGQVRLRRG